MLAELSIRDFALIERLAISFGPRFTAITGETGAGKSILIGALGTLMGMRTGPDMVRTGAEKALVEGRFVLPPKHPALGTIRDLGGEAENGEVILRRELCSDGRTRAWIGGVAVPVKTLKDVADRLVDFHGQHDHQLLLSPAEHGNILDSYAENGELLELVRERAGSLARLRAQRVALVERQKEIAARRDMIDFERKELSEINPQPGELEGLDAERKVLENVERLTGLLAGLSQLMSEAEDSIVSRLGQGRRWLHEAAQIDARLGQETLGQYEQLEVLAQELATRIAGRLGSLEANPLRLEQVEARLASLRRLVRRYGGIEEALARRAELRAMVDSEEQSAERIAALEREIVVEHGRFAEAVTKLARSRERAAAALGRQVTESFAALGMDRARLSVDLARAAAGGPVSPVESDAVEIDGTVCQAGVTGAEQVEFLISTNPGEPMRPLVRIASGGEISRVMLAIKSVLAAHDPVVTMVFDEIDQGISGRTADVVGQRMRDLARHRQVVAITHIPQIAACADEQITVHKRETRGHAVTEAQVITSEQRPYALAELLGGPEVTQTALEHARAMLRELKEPEDGR